MTNTHIRKIHTVPYTTLTWPPIKHNAYCTTPPVKVETTMLAVQKILK